MHAEAKRVLKRLQKAYKLLIFLKFHPDKNPANIITRMKMAADYDLDKDIILTFAKWQYGYVGI